MNRSVSSLLAFALLSAPVFIALSQGQVRFAAVGDYNISSSTQSVSTMVAGWAPDFVITVGDNNYSGTGTTAAWDDAVGQYYGTFIKYPAGSTSRYNTYRSVNAFVPALGNHDVDATGYTDYFDLPGNERYYDFVKGSVHFFVLDSDTREGDGYTATSTQGVWLQNGLATAPEPWKIVYFHHAPYTSGTGHGNTSYMQWPFQSWGATAVLAGHEHVYERVMLNGFPYIVDGFGGNSLNAFGTPVTGSVYRYNADHGAMLIEANATTITFSAYSVQGGVNGTFLDSYSITRAAAVTVKAKLFLQGPFSSGSMSTALRSSGYLPKTQFYGNAPWNYPGSESVGSIPVGVVDWMLVELRTGTAASTTVSRRAAFLKSDGAVVVMDGTSAVVFAGIDPGSYYLVLRHRNHISVMSASAVALSGNSALYDFTQASGQYYAGDACPLGGGVWGMWAGDVDAGGDVTALDRAAVWNERGQTGYRSEDVDLNGVVGDPDRAITWNNRNKVSRVPP
jgi:tartrate-resistant acid phosphatase type 5